jgi:hypothetical protein
MGVGIHQPQPSELDPEEWIARLDAQRPVESRRCAVDVAVREQCMGLRDE